MTIGLVQYNKAHNEIVVEILHPCYDAHGRDQHSELCRKIDQGLSELGSDTRIRIAEREAFK